jgi:hypothetical protein
MSPLSGATDGLCEDDPVDKVLVRWRGATVTVTRALQVGGILVLLLLGAVLPYLTLEHFDQSFAVTRDTASLTNAGDLTGLDPTYLPSYDPAVRPEFNVAFNVLGLGPALQIFASLVATVTCWGLLYDEINKFFFWPLHLSSYLLIAVPIPLFVGLNMVRDLQVTARLGPAWIFAVLAGVLILVVTLRARQRIDTYGGV